MINKFIFKKTANSIHRIIDVKNGKVLIEADFYMSNKFVPRPMITPLRNMRVLYSALTDFPQNAGGGSCNAFGQATWAACRSGTGGTVSYSDDFYTLRSDVGGIFIQRCFFVFDTSSLTFPATVLAADLRIYRDDTIEPYINDDSFTMIITPQNQADPLELGTAGDYTSVTFANRGSIGASGTVNHVYNSVPFSDFTDIKTTTYTKVALMTDRDFFNSAPTGHNRLGMQAYGDTNPPVLRVTYTVSQSLLIGGEI